MIGQAISHYKILEKLGEGGMGVVYRALDTDLDREVALKFLPPHVKGTEEEQARFIQEAKSASALNHPNVCSIHSIGTHDGQRFIDMELVEGTTLRERIDQEKITAEDAINYAIQIGEALGEAHSKNIIHRDVKAENIMVNQRDQIKVMDFGLAKLKGSLKLTKTSSTVGTLSYMAPEQVQGAEADVRSDIFSFGVVLYELLAGRTPFRGEHEAAMVYSIVNEEPEPIQNYLPEVSPEILHIVSRALEKNPDDRYQSVGEMVVDLRRVKRDSTSVSIAGTRTGHISSAGGGRRKSGNLKTIAIAGSGLVVLLVLFFIVPWDPGDQSVGPRTLAVLPFENLGDPEKEYFADGITDEITSRLSQLSGLGVVARSSARQYKKTTKSLDEVGEELGVDYILMGTVRWSGGDDQRVRVYPELVDVRTMHQTWSQPFEAAFSDAFTIQADVASEVARALDVELLQMEREGLGQKLTDNPEAYDYYLKGLEYFDRGFKQEDFRSGILMFERAIEADPGFAAAYARLSRSHSTYYWFYYDRTPERVKKAKEAADRAIALDPRLSDAYAAKGWYFYHGQLDYENALKQFDLALQYWPNNPDAIYGIAAIRRRQGDIGGAIKAFRKAILLDPRSASMVRQLGESLTLNREYAAADTAYDRTLLLSPDSDIARWNKVQNILLWTGDTERAREVMDEVMTGALGTDRFRELSNVQIAFYERDYEAVSAAIEKFKAFGNMDNQFRFRTPSLEAALVERAIGDEDKAVKMFAEAMEEIEGLAIENPDDGRFHSTLGVIYAGLGRKDDAIREAQRGVSLLPVETEAWRGSYRLIDLATVYTMVGEDEKAIDMLERLLSIPCELSEQLLRIDPTWDALRENPRFQALLESDRSS